MSPIDPTSPLLAQIRAQAVAWARQAQGKERPGQQAGARRGTPRAPGDWLGHVATSVAAIDREDPNRQRKAFRCYLQALLARECGIEDDGAPDFQQLVDRVLETMEGEPQLQAAIQKAGEALLRTASP
ncbi:MAG: hypothetical protein QM767_14515 [Anaeromyxobacter sp.]